MNDEQGQSEICSIKKREKGNAADNGIHNCEAVALFHDEYVSVLRTLNALTGYYIVEITEVPSRFRQST